MTSGETIEMNCPATDTFASTKEKLWQRKHYDTNPNLYTFRLLEGEVFFSDQQRIADFIRIERIFHETREKEHSLSISSSPPPPSFSSPSSSSSSSSTLPPTSSSSSSSPPTFLDLLVIPCSDIGDVKKRESKQPNLSGLPLQWGYLWKRGKSGTFGSSHKWKRRFFLLQDITLFYFESEQAFRSSTQALDYIPMGSIYPTLTPEIMCNKLNYSFELDATLLTGEKKLKLNLCAESESEMKSWLMAIGNLNLRRVKSMIVTICEELRSRGFDSEGLFRISGNKESMEKLKYLYDLGSYPTLSEIQDEHALTGLVKLTIRELPDPLLTHALYSDFVKVASYTEKGGERLNKLKEVIQKLPASNYFFCDYLMGFLKLVSLRSDKNMMTPANCNTKKSKQNNQTKQSNKRG